ESDQSADRNIRKSSQNQTVRSTPTTNATSALRLPVGNHTRRRRQRRRTAESIRIYEHRLPTHKEGNVQRSAWRTCLHVSKQPRNRHPTNQRQTTERRHLERKRTNRSISMGFDPYATIGMDVLCRSWHEMERNH